MLKARHTPIAGCQWNKYSIYRQPVQHPLDILDRCRCEQQKITQIVLAIFKMMRINISLEGLALYRHSIETVGYPCLHTWHHLVQNKKKWIVRCCGIYFN